MTQIDSTAPQRNHANPAESLRDGPGQAGRYQIGIDLGGTKIETILFDPGGRQLFRHRIATPGLQPRRYQAILEAVAGLIELTSDQIPAAKKLSAQPRPQPTIGIGVPGTINQQTLLVQNANTTCLNGRPFKHDLERLLDRPVAIDNDANCFALAEYRGGAAQGYGIVFGIIMGTGCGGGLCIDGRIHQGRHGIAGEWGHMSIDPRGARCFCGNRGCIDTMLTGPGVEKAYFERFGEQRTMKDIVDGYRRSDPDCRDIFEQFIEDFGRSLGGLISVLDPDVVVLGGGLSNIDELYSLGIDRIRHYAFHDHLQTPILRNHLGDSAGVYGAARIGLNGG